MNYQGKAVVLTDDELLAERELKRQQDEAYALSVEEEARRKIALLPPEQQAQIARQEALLAGAVPLPEELSLAQNRAVVTPESGLTWGEKLENSLADLWRGTRLLPRAGAEILASSPAGLVTDIIAGTANLALPKEYQLPSTRETFRQVGDIAGLPVPTPTEQSIINVAGMAGGAEAYRRGAQQAGQALLRQPPVGQIGTARELTGRTMAELGKGTPGMTIAAGAGGGVGFESAQAQGATPAEAMLASIFGSGLALLPAAATNELKSLISSARTPEAKQMLQDRLAYWKSVLKDRAPIPASGVAPNRLTRSAEQSASNLVGGSGIMAETAEQVQGAVQQRVGEVSRELAGQGAEITPETAGMAVAGIFKGAAPDVRKESWEYGFNRLIGRQFADVERKLPKGFVVTPKNFLRVLSGNARKLEGLKGVSETALVGNQKLKDAFNVFSSAIEANGGVASLDDIRDLRSGIGEQIKSGIFAADSGIDNKTYRALYAALSDDIESSIKDPATLKLYRETNAKYAAELDSLSRIAAIVNSAKGSGEQIFRSVVSKSGAQSQLISDIYKRLPQRDRRLFTAALMEEFIKAKPGQQAGLEEVPSIRTFLTEYNKLRPNARQVIFGDPSFGKTYQKDMNAILRVMDDIEKQRGYLSNLPGSGRVTSIAISGGSTALGGLIGALSGQSITSALVGTAAGLLPTIGAYGTAKLMTNPRFVRWLASGSRLPAKEAAITSWVSQLGKIAEQDEELREAHQAIVEEMKKQKESYKPSISPEFEGRAVEVE